MPGEIALGPDDPAEIGGYRLLRRLAQGGHGVVYLAQAPSGERVAVKLLRAGWLADPAARDRLAKEVAAARQVARFATAQVIEARVDGDDPFIVSEYVDGPSLTEYVRDHGPLPGAALERLAVGTATALVAIHQADIVHRDFKPSNVMLGPDGPRVIDFGIARNLTHETTVTDRIFCTPAYAAPEQITGKPVGPPADLFAWACTMVFAATGAEPFRAENPTALMYRILNSEPDLAAVPGPLADLLPQCLAKDPALRPTAEQTVEQLLRRFKPAHEGTQSHVPGPVPFRTEDLTSARPPASSEPPAVQAVTPHAGSLPTQVITHPTTRYPAAGHQAAERPAAGRLATGRLAAARLAAGRRPRSSRDWLLTGGAVLAAATVLLIGATRFLGPSSPSRAGHGSTAEGSATPSSGQGADPMAGTSSASGAITPDVAATTAAPTEAGPEGTGPVIPAAFDGTWAGTLRTTVGSIPTASVSLTMTTGARQAQLTNQTLHCSGTLDVVQPRPTDQTLHLHLHVGLDPTHWCPLPLATITVVANGPDSVVLRWRDALITNRALLTRGE